MTRLLLQAALRRLLGGQIYAPGLRPHRMARARRQQRWLPARRRDRGCGGAGNPRLGAAAAERCAAPIIAALRFSQYPARQWTGQSGTASQADVCCCCRARSGRSSRAWHGRCARPVRRACTRSTSAAATGCSTGAVRSTIAARWTTGRPFLAELPRAPFDRRDRSLRRLPPGARGGRRRGGAARPDLLGVRGRLHPAELRDLRAPRRQRLLRAAERSGALRGAAGHDGAAGAGGRADLLPRGDARHGVLHRRHHRPRLVPATTCTTGRSTCSRGSSGGAASIASWSTRPARRRCCRSSAARCRASTFLIALQTAGDSQVTTHSGFRSVAHFIEEVTASFAAHAPADAAAGRQAPSAGPRLQRLHRAAARARPPPRRRRSGCAMCTT